jgi:agmatine deiminase
MPPIDRDFYFPAEWQPHESTWLSWPVNTDTWDAKFPAIYPSYISFIKEIAKGEIVNILCGTQKEVVRNLLKEYDCENENIRLHSKKTNDSWCRDHGPGFLINKNSKERLIVNWEYNAWGGKYPPFDEDNSVPIYIAEHLGLKYISPGIVMEGGSVEFNGSGTVMSSQACLLNKNRNSHLSKKEIEKYLCDFYGQEQVLWVNDGIVGDDTDGHIDDTIRFVNEDTVLAMVEPNRLDPNHELLQENLELLKKMRLKNGNSLNIVTAEMPDPVYERGERLPASYANFYISNAAVIVPTYRCKKDDKALEIISGLFKNRPVVGIDSTEIIWGLGSFHCLSQQEPKANFV